jgi:GDPmannose 4,6-dehydratase
MLQAEKPDTYVLATNRTETVRDFVTMSFKAVGIILEWSGQEENEIAKDIASNQIVVRVNPIFYRPAEVELLIGDPTKANNELNWHPRTNLEELCEMMVQADLVRNETGFSY